MIKIIEYTDDLKQHIKTLNAEWLEKYFSLEPNDVLQLSNPREEIINKGGLIYYAEQDGEIVGTVTLMKVDDETYELAKMAVTDKSQGKGIGKILIEHSIKIANELKIKKLILYSNTKLETAISLYRRYGFEEIPLSPGIYKRANIKMQKTL